MRCSPGDRSIVVRWRLFTGLQAGACYCHVVAASSFYSCLRQARPAEDNCPNGTCYSRRLPDRLRRLSETIGLLNVSDTRPRAQAHSANRGSQTRFPRLERLATERSIRVATYIRYVYGWLCKPKSLSQDPHSRNVLALRSAHRVIVTLLPYPHVQHLP